MRERILACFEIESGRILLKAEVCSLLRSVSRRQGSLLFKVIGAIMILPWMKPLAAWIGHYNFNASEVVIYFHVFYNLLSCLVMLPFVEFRSRLWQRLIPVSPVEVEVFAPRYLD